MLQKILHRILVRRHFWRHASFSEIAELYASRVLRMLAMHIAASFMAIYLYQQGYPVWMIAAFFGALYLFKAFISVPMAMLAAWFGPKHGILISNLLFIPSMIAFALAPDYGEWLLILVIVFQGASSALYSISYAIDFSKVKSADHAGKEIAYMNIVEKVTTGLSPLIGGLIAYIFGPQIVLIIAAFLFTLAALPLLRTAEQVQSFQKLTFKGFPWHLICPNVTAQMALGVDVFTSGTVWSLFTAVFIIGIAADNQVYAVNGALMSVVMFSALASSYAYGRLIDGNKGQELLKYAAIANALTHFFRPVVGSPLAVAGLNVANEAATTGYSMSYTRGLFDNADLSGHRTTYIGISEAIANVGGALAGAGLVLLTMFMSEQKALEVFFYLVAFVVLLIATAKFPLYRK